MKLIWEDTFEFLDHSKWECAVDAFGGGNAELQLYTDSSRNVRVEDNKLVIEAHKEKSIVMGTAKDFSSGRLRTKFRGDWDSGLVEVSARLPVGKGLWPAIWMLPTWETFGAWPQSGELDILETKGGCCDAIGAVHYGDMWPKNRHMSHNYKCDDLTGFNTFALLRDNVSISWLLNGKVTNKIYRSSFSPDPFGQKFHLLLNLAVGGNLPGNPDLTTPFPARMEVDWVRVWQ
jgi:beta-glucanase (GH16 family)